MLCGGSSSYAVDSDNRVFAFGIDVCADEDLVHFEEPTEQIYWQNCTIIPGQLCTVVVDENGALYMHGIMDKLSKGKQEGIVVTNRTARINVKKASR